MAVRTVHGLESLVIVRMRYRRVGVATDAAIRSVSGSGKFRSIYEKRNGFTDGVRLVKAFVRVAIQTIAVFQGWRGNETSSSKGKKKRG